MKPIPSLLLLFSIIVPLFANPIDIGSRRELFVDDYLIQELQDDIALRLNHPIPREIVITHDAPWEGTGSGYHSIFKDGDRYRMYYKALHVDFSEGELNAAVHPRFTCYAESDDGIHWRKPSLGLHAFNGSTENNITISDETFGELKPDGAHPAIFKDSNPRAPVSTRYKAILRSHEPNGLVVLKSADGLAWSPMFDSPILHEKGAFDSQNLAFWDPMIQQYRAYWRAFTGGDAKNPEWNPKGNRTIRTGLSQDLQNWEQIQDLSFADTVPQQLYTNGVHPYHRAPHFKIGFPKRYIERENGASMKSLPDPENRAIRYAAHPRYGLALSEALFMSSRDGYHFKRWNEAFLRPGPERPGTWHYGAPSLAWGLIETPSALPGAAKEISLYALEDYWHGDGSALRRYTLRLDGFVSASAKWAGGRLLTKPLIFSGDRLELNFATSASGKVRVEIQDLQGKALPGFSLEDCPAHFGDSVDKTIVWRNRPGLSKLAGKPVQILFELKDADLYSFRFQ